MRPESPCRPATTGPALAPTPTDPVGWTACSEVDQSTFYITHWHPSLTHHRRSRFVSWPGGTTRTAVVKTVARTYSQDESAKW